MDWCLMLKEIKCQNGSAMGSILLKQLTNTDLTHCVGT